MNRKNYYNLIQNITKYIQILFIYSYILYEKETAENTEKKHDKLYLRKDKFELYSRRIDTIVMKFSVNKLICFAIIYENK